MGVFRIAAVMAAGAMLSACATIIQGTTESVSVNTTPETGAQCALKNSEGTWYVTTPGTATVHKTKNDMTIDCTKPGFAPGHTVAISHFGGTTVGNVIAGGAIGLTVDAASGANFYYDSPINVALGQPLPPGSAPVAAVTTNPGDLPPRLDHAYPNYQPAYPDAAQVNGEQGNVVLNVRVGADGTVRNVKVDQSSGFDDLDNAAVAGVLRWRFLPGTDGGAIETQWTKITIAYRLPTAVVVPSSAAAPPPAAPSH
jgi:TonB family protein